MHSSLAANISPARIDDDAVYHPHRATWVEFQQPWSAFTYTKLIRPHKFPIPGVKPRHFDLSCPDVPAGFDPDAVPTQELLDDTWEAFCHAAEEELIQKVGLDPSSRQADQCRGRGGPPRFRKCPLLPTHTEAIASYGEAKRWRWFANELAWLGIIEVKLFSYTGASGLVLTTLHQQRHASIRKLRDRFRHHMLLEGVAELQEFFEVFTSRDRGYEDLQELSAWRLSCSQYASYLEWQIGKERRDSFKQRLEDDFPGSQGLLHRVTKWRQAWQAPKGSISKKLLPAAPQAAVDQELHDWSKVWTTGSGFPKPWRGLQQVAVTPPSPHHLRGLAQRFRAKTGIGVDGWQPKLWAYLTDGTLSVLASLLAWCQQLGRWPSQVHLLLVFIIGKLDGGGRPIILLPGPCRIWEAWQLPTIRSWLAAHPRSYDYTAAGQSSERALWKALLDDELVLGTGIRAATMLADLAKCYEKVPHERMWWLAAWWEGPLEVVALALESFALGRVIRLGEACSAEVLSSTALPAGSRFAPTFLRFYLTLCLDDLLGVFRFTIYLYVDDIALRVMSTEARVLHMLPQATRLLFWMPESFLGLEVARARDGARGKCSFLQTATPSSGLTQAMAVLGVPPSTSERWLGIDYGPSVKTENQSAPVRHARLKIAKQRWPKIRGLPRARGGKLKMVVRQGLGASVAYGARVRGTPRPIVRFIQQKDRAVRRGATAFTSRVLHDGLDPSCADTLVLAPLLAWAREAWDHPEGRRAQATAWARVQQQLALYMDADAQELWSVVRGPAGATSVTVRAHGWSMPSAFEIVLPPRGGVLQGGDVHLDLLQICPKSVEAAVLLAARSRALCQWAAAQPERAALLPAPWLTPARQLVKRRKQDGWLQHHADAVKKAVLGGFPSQEALFSSGQADTPYCQLCDDTTCFGTHQHYYWRCGSPTCATVREQLTAHDASPTFRDVGHLGVSASSSEASRWLWGRGLRRTPCYGLAWSLPSQRTHWIVNGAAPELTDVLVSDGSVKGLDDLRHGGWAALQCTAEADDVVQGLYGPLPFPDPSSVLAELWGLLHALRHSVFITAIIIDNAQVVQGLARGRAWCCSAARPYAHVWLEIWDRLDDMDILPGRELSVIKVASHISQAKRLELPEEVQIHMRHNDLADEWAKQGADLSAPPEWATLQVKQELKATKRVLEYIGHFRVLLDGVKLAEPRPKRQQGQEANIPQAARPQAGPRHPHVLEVCRGYSKCTNCGKVARTRLAAFQLQECRGRLQGLQGKLVKSAAKRGSVAAPPLGLCDSEQTMEIRTASWHQWVFEPLSSDDDQGGDAAGRAAEDAHGYDDTDEFAALSVHSDLEVVEADGKATQATGTQASERESSPNPDLAPGALQPQEEGAPAGGARREGVLRIRSAAATCSQVVDDGATAGAGAAPVPTVPPAAQPAGEPGADQGELASSLDVDGKAATQAAAAVCSAPLAAHQARAGQGSLKHGGKAPRTGSSASSAAAAGSGQGGLAPLAGSPPPSAGAAAASEPERGARGRAASAQPARSGQALPATARAASSEPRPHTVEIIGNFVVCVVCGSYYSSVARNLGGPRRRLDPRDPGDKERLRANIGFYLHAPFPSVNSFMTIPVREELLTGMLASDLIGFQFFPYAQWGWMDFFLAVKRILGLDPQYQPGGYMCLDYNGRQAHVKVSHFVYPFQDTKQVVDQGSVATKVAEVTKLFLGRTLFAGMDRCDGLSGLVPKFRAFRRFLLSKPEYKGKVLLIQYLFDDWNNGQLLQQLQARPQAHPALEHRVAYVEELVRDEQAQLVQFSSDINAAFRHLDEARLPDLEASAAQQQEELRQLRAQQQQLLEGLAPAALRSEQLAAELAALRAEHTALRREHEALRSEHGALRDCLLGWAPLASEAAPLCSLRRAVGAAGDRGACLARLAAGCRALRGCARRAAEGGAGRDLDEAVWDAVPAFEPSEAVLERWSSSDTVQGVLPGVRAKAVVGLSDTLSFGDVHAVLQQLGVQLDHFVDTFARMPSAAGGRDERELMGMADSILRRFASEGRGADEGVSGTPAGQRGTLSCRDLFRLLEVVGVSLKRFKAMVTGVEELEDEASPSFVQVGSYNLLRQLGSGSKGVCCWLGEHAVSEAKVAIKWPVKAAEMEVLRDLGRHDACGAPRMLGAPRLLDSGVHGGKEYVAMELLGSTLSKVFQGLAARSFRHRWRGVCAIGRMLVRRFQALHARGYVHCDVSPDNVLVGLAEVPSGGGGIRRPPSCTWSTSTHAAAPRRRGPGARRRQRGVGLRALGQRRGAAAGGRPRGLGVGAAPRAVRLPAVERVAAGRLQARGLQPDQAPGEPAGAAGQDALLGGQGAALERHWGRPAQGIPGELLRYLRACGVEAAEAGRPWGAASGRGLLLELLGGGPGAAGAEADRSDARLLAQALAPTR
ncbi:unnamed protein product [Prorocentrum cordatum]|uniref:Uncharacterized protein n=1 Tax=Prorocentrum cordatum TaxID=2364126 RepID=A0ABN9UTJ0_9DINO|nr:unnamed protein product [Polarella glacialis]